MVMYDDGGDHGICKIAEDEATGQDGVALHHRRGHLGGGITI